VNQMISAVACIDDALLRNPHVNAVHVTVNEKGMHSLCTPDCHQWAVLHAWCEECCCNCCCCCFKCLPWCYRPPGDMCCKICKVFTAWKHRPRGHCKPAAQWSHQTYTTRYNRQQVLRTASGTGLCMDKHRQPAIMRHNCR
jgi:hypothetical protein